tara:strand:+ start:643 stop:882 length:240 start_codon:yes stop_codon:yes gene_type:complete
LLPEDVFQKLPGIGKVSLLGFMGQGRIGIVKTVALLFKMDMAGKAGETIVFFYAPDIIPSVILTDGLKGPRYYDLPQIP